MKRFLMAALVVAAATGLAATSQAATVSANVNVGVNVSPQCSVVAADINFQPWNGSSASTGSGNITVNCTSGTQYSIALNSGINVPAPKRTLTSASGSFTGTTEVTTPGAGQIPYTLTRPGGGEWGDQGFANTYAPGTVVTGTGNGTNQVHSITGQIDPMPTFSGNPGLYYDYVTVTVHH